MKDLATQPLSSPARRRPGRPAKPDALTPAERTKAYRQRQLAEGLTAVKCYLPPESMAYLRALCEIHRLTLSEAIARSVAAAVRGEPLPR